MYKALNVNVGVSTSVELCRTKLDSVRQGSDSVQTYSQRFRSTYNELTYALQSEHSNAMERKIALQIEEKSAVKKYIMNLRDDISSQVRPIKPKTINEALQETIEAEVWNKERNKNRLHKPTVVPQRTVYQPRPMQQNFRPTPPPRKFANTTPKPVNQNMPLQQRMIIKCTYCQKLGHTENQLPKTKFSAKQQF